MEPDKARANRDPDLSQILDAIPGAVLTVNRSYDVLYANFSAENLLKASAGQMGRMGLAKTIPFQTELQDLVAQVFDKSTALNAYQVDISSPRVGEGVVVDVYAAPLPESAGQAILVFRQRSVADRIDRQLSHRGAARSVTGLAAMLAHEIKNPLSGIRGAAQLLETVVDDPDRELTGLITQETDRIVKLVDQMEVFSDETPLEPEPVNVHSVLSHVRQIAENGFGRHVTFIESYDPSLPDVAGSRDQLIQIFLNLVKNACHALEGADDPIIRLTSAYQPGVSIRLPGGEKRATLSLAFTVSDNGPGVPEEIRPNIFDPFVTTRVNGSGLGLALVAKLINRHRGFVEYEDRGEGAMFRVLLAPWRDKRSFNGSKKHEAVEP